MDWGSIAAAGIGGLGGFLGGNEEHYGPGDFLPNGIGKNVLRPLAGSIMDLQTPEYYQGMDPRYQANLDRAGGWGLPGHMGHQMMWDAYGSGQNALGSIGLGMDYMQGLQDRGPNAFQYDQGTYDQVMGNLAPGVQNMFDVGARDIQQGYDFNVLPGLNMQAGLAGGYGGTKALQQSALGQAQTAGNIQNLGANLWQNAANQANQAGYGAGMANLNTANAFDQNMLNNYGRFGALGGNLLGQAQNMGLENMRMGLQAGQTQQQMDMDKWNFEQQAPWLDLANRLNLVNQTAIGVGAQGDRGMSGWEGALQGAQAGLGIYNAGQNAGWWGGSPTSSGAVDRFGNNWFGEQYGDPGYIDF